MPILWLVLTSTKETMSRTSPLFEHYDQIKAALPEGSLLLFRIGDFYEAFGADAVKLHETLGYTLTKRRARQMAGLPYHALESDIKKLTDAGFTVTIAENQDKKTFLSKETRAMLRHVA